MSTLSETSMDTERVINEVRLRPALWDMTNNLYKDRDARMQAWLEVCIAVIPNFNDLTSNDKKEAGKKNII